jgi:hypothetical protein
MYMNIIQAVSLQTKKGTEHHKIEPGELGHYTPWPAEGSQFRVLVWKRFFPLHVIQTGSGAHTASFPMCNVGLFLRR